MAYGDTVYLFDGTKSANASGKVLEASAFKSTEMPSGFERDLDNNIIWGDYMQLVTPSEDNKDNQDNKNNQDDKR